jgi:heterodisulfide reductase subunit A
MSAEGRMALFLCSWGGGREPTLDLEALRAYAASLTEVALAQVVDRVCSRAGQEAIVSALSSAEVDRFVVAACPRRTKERLYRRIADQAGIAPFMFEVADIREQSAKVHPANLAQGKAADLIRMAVAKCRLLSPVPLSADAPESRQALVVGDGISALEVSERIASERFPVVVVSGGTNPKPVGNDPAHGHITLLSRSKVIEFAGYLGAFKALVETPEGIISVDCGAVVLAVDSIPPILPQGRGISQSAFDGLLAEGRGLPSDVVMITGYDPVASCGSSCRSAAVENALRMKQIAPKARVTIIARDIWTFGRRELSYRDAAKCGVLFVRSEAPPQIDRDSGRVVVFDATLGEELAIKSDLVVTDDVLVPSGAAGLAEVFEVPIDGSGRLCGTSVRLRPEETVRAGVFVCGSAAVTGINSEERLEAASAASLACEVLRAPSIEFGGAVAEVDKDKCSACLACVRSCPYGAPVIGEAGKAEIEMERCQGCGVCVGLCPSKAIDMHRYTDAQLIAQERAFVQGAKD